MREPSFAGRDDPGVRPAIGAVGDAGAAALLVGRQEGAPRVRILSKYQILGLSLLLKYFEVAAFDCLSRRSQLFFQLIFTFFVIQLRRAAAVPLEQEQPRRHDDGAGKT